MATSCEHIYAAGDVCEFPLSIQENRKVSIGHWQIALIQGRIAGKNMMSRLASFRSVPFFWTTQYNISLRYTGYGADFVDGETIVHGDLTKLKFIAFYFE